MVTTLLLSCTTNGNLTTEEAIDLLYDLVDEGTNPHPKVYARVQRKLRELEDCLACVTGSSSVRSPREPPSCGCAAFERPRDLGSASDDPDGSIGLCRVPCTRHVAG